MNTKKDLTQMFDDMHFPEYMIDQLLSDPAKVKTLLLRMCKPPHKKEGDSPYDTKTKYGLLYTTFNTLKKKLGLKNYDVRQDFIAWYIKDKKFKKMFKDYRASAFDIKMKPSFIVIDTTFRNPIFIKNLRLATHDEAVNIANVNRSRPVSEYHDEVLFKIHPSVRKASIDANISPAMIRQHLKKERGKFRETTDKDRKIMEKREKHTKVGKNRCDV